MTHRKSAALATADLGSAAALDSTVARFGLGRTMRRIIPVLATVVIGTTGVSSAAHAAMVDFGVAPLGGTITFGGGARLDTSSKLDLDHALLIVTNLGVGDDSGLSVFPGGADNTVTLTQPIDYGSGNGAVNTRIIGGDILKKWTGLVGGQPDSFTETLSTVSHIDRATPNAITVVLRGTLADTLGMFVNSPTELILSANEVAGPHGAISVAITDTSLASGIPESSTWLMMALGFIGLGYAAVRGASKDRLAVVDRPTV